MFRLEGNMKDFNKFLKQYSEDFTTEMQEMVKKYTEAITNETAKRAPVDTGNLKQSIEDGVDSPFYSHDGLTGYIGTTKDYAIYTEFGTRYIPAHEYFKRSYEKYYDEFIKELERKGLKMK